MYDITWYKEDAGGRAVPLEKTFVHLLRNYCLTTHGICGEHGFCDDDSREWMCKQGWFVVSCVHVQ